MQHRQLARERSGIVICGHSPVAWGLIDDQPVQSHALHSLPELVEVDWFLDIAVSSQVVPGYQVPLFFGRGHDDNWDRLRPRVALCLSEHFHPIDFG